MKKAMKWFVVLVLLISACVSMMTLVHAEWISFDIDGLEYTRHNVAGAEDLVHANIGLGNILVGDTIYLCGTWDANNLSAAPVLNIDKSGAMEAWQDSGAVNVYSRDGIITNASKQWFMSDSGGYTPTAPGLYRVYAVDPVIGVSRISFFYVQSNDPSAIGRPVNLKYDGAAISDRQHLDVNRYDAKQLTWDLPFSAFSTYVSVRYWDENMVWHDLPGYSGVEVSQFNNAYTLDMAKITATYGFGRYQVALTSGNGRGTNSNAPITLIFYTKWKPRYGTCQNGQMQLLVREPSVENPEIWIDRVVDDGYGLPIDRPLTVIASPNAGYYTTKIEAEKRTYTSEGVFTSTVEVLAENKNKVTDINYHVSTNTYAKSSVDEVVITPYFAKENYNIVFYDHDKSTVLYQKTVAYGDKFPAVSAAVRPGYTFLQYKRMGAGTAPDTYNTGASVADLGDNGTTVAYYATYKTANVLVSITPKLSASVLDIGKTAELVVTANYVNEDEGTTVSKNVKPNSVTADNADIVTIGTLSEATVITAIKDGNVTLTVTYEEQGAMVTGKIQLAVIAGQSIGNVLRVSVANQGTSSLKEQTLASASAVLPLITNVTFVGIRTENGNVTAAGAYTPIQKTSAGVFSDTISFYGKNEGNETVANGQITVTYTVEESLVLSVTPDSIAMGAPATIKTQYVLDNGYKETVHADYTLSRHDIVSIQDSTAIAIGYGDVTITASYKGLSANANLNVALPEVVYLTDGTTKLYTKGAGMTVVLEEYANYYDYNDDGFVNRITPGGNIVIARVYMHDELSFNPVGVALSFDANKLVPMNYDARSGNVKYVFGDSGFDAASAVESVRDMDSVYVTEVLTDCYGTNYLYGLIGTTNGATSLKKGDCVQVMSLLFAKRGDDTVDASVIDFYDGADGELSKAYKTDWGNSGKTISQITGVVSENEITIAEAFGIVYPAPAPKVVLTGITLSADKTALFVGETAKLSALALFSDGTSVPVEAEISADFGDITDGQYFATRAGNVNIMASYEGFTNTLALTITEVKAVGMLFSCDKATLELGETAVLTAVVTYNNGTEKTVREGLSITATPASGVEIQNNTVTAIAAGEIQITASFEGVSKSITITVNEPKVTVVRGDVNCDGTVRMNDLIMLLSYLASSTPLSEQGMINADVTEDGKVLMNDLIVLLSYLSTGNWS